MADWETLLKIAGLLTFLGTAAALIYAVFRTKSEDSWRKTAERLKFDYDQLTVKYTEEREARKDAERERDEFTQRYLRCTAKVEWYESRHGPITSTDIHTTRGRDESLVDRR